jgi:DNA-binding PadR family transcriptional regulator
MPKPRGTTGATKMKILAVMCHNHECDLDSYGYNIWQDLKEYFHIYMNDNDIRNIYHHLNDLKTLGYIDKCEYESDDPRCFYRITSQGLEIKNRYGIYMDILYRKKGHTRIF